MTATAITFRTATAADVATIVDLVESAYRGDVSRQGWTTEADLLDGRRTDIDGVAALVARAGSEVVLAERDGRIVACAHIEKHEATGYFGMFSVQPDLQGGGVGHALMAECERRAREHFGCTRMHMTVIRQREELIAWYLRRGYRDTGERRPFPYGDARFGLPKRDDLEFLVLDRAL